MMAKDGKEGKREGMARAERHADPYWWQCMLECAKEVAHRKPYFYSDDVVVLCREKHPNATTHEPRAIGPLMRRAEKFEYCTQTQSFIPGTEAQAHHRPKLVWYSLIYQGRPHPRPRRHKVEDPRQFKMRF